MSIINSPKYRLILQSKLTELTVDKFNRDEIINERSADELETLQQQLNREVAIRNLDRSSKLFKSIESALTRIDDETYGLCLRCEDEIPEKRLKAVPWAAYCVECQELIDRHPTNEAGDELGVH
jgi:DnaK suppressor protein